MHHRLRGNCVVAEQQMAWTSSGSRCERAWSIMFQPIPNSLFPWREVAIADPSWPLSVHAATIHNHSDLTFKHTYLADHKIRSLAFTHMPCLVDYKLNTYLVNVLPMTVVNPTLRLLHFRWKETWIYVTGGRGSLVHLLIARPW